MNATDRKLKMRNRLRRKVNKTPLTAMDMTSGSQRAHIERAMKDPSKLLSGCTEKQLQEAAEKMSEQIGQTVSIDDMKQMVKMYQTMKLQTSDVPATTASASLDVEEAPPPAADEAPPPAEDQTLPSTGDEAPPPE